MSAPVQRNISTFKIRHPFFRSTPADSVSCPAMRCIVSGGRIVSMRSAKSRILNKLGKGMEENGRIRKMLHERMDCRKMLTVWEKILAYLLRVSAGQQAKTDDFCNSQIDRSANAHYNTGVGTSSGRPVCRSGRKEP